MMKPKGKENLLYLGEIIERDKVEYGSNNMIISPTGSGKTYFVTRDLNNKYEGKRLMLVSTESLKTMLSQLEGAYTTKDISKGNLEISEESIYVMTYAEFGYKVIWNDKFIKDFSVILCDEIHSLFEYYSYKDSGNLSAAIKVLFNKHEDKVIFYFTATTEKIDKFIDEKNNDLYEHVNIIDYYDNGDIMRYFDIKEEQITDIYELEEIIAKLKDFREADRKGVVFNERISSMKRITELLERQGLRSIEMWSVNNEDNPMTKEQLYVRDYLLKNEVIPEGYDFIIINGAMREGWNLEDERVYMMVLNTLDETDREQARGRYRADLELLVSRVDGDSLPIDVKIMKKEKSLGVIESLIGEYIDGDDKDLIVDKLNIRRAEDGRLVKWTTIKKTLEKNGYDIDDVQKTIDGKRKRVSIITKIEKEVKPSTKSKSSKFLASLADTKFAEVNKEHLANYINKDSRIAYKHIKSSYDSLIGSEGWSGRKFADITYMLARDNKLFSKKNYSEYGRKFNGLHEVEVLTERAKYEKAAERKLEETKNKEEQELLAYIAGER